MAYANFKKTEMYDEIGNELKKSRKAAGLSIEEVSRKLREMDTDVSPSTISRIENGQRRIDDNLLELLCKIYGADANSLVCRATDLHRISLKATGLGLSEEIFDLFSELDDDGRAFVMRMLAYMKALNRY